MIDLDVSRYRCERYNATISALIIRRCARDSMRRGKDFNREAIHDQYLENQQTLEDCTAFLTMILLVKNFEYALGLAMIKTQSETITNATGGAWYLHHKSAVIVARLWLADLPPQAVTGLQAIAASCATPITRQSDLARDGNHPSPLVTSSQ